MKEIKEVEEEKEKETGINRVIKRKKITTIHAPNSSTVKDRLKYRNRQKVKERQGER